MIKIKSPICTKLLMHWFGWHWQEIATDKKLWCHTRWETIWVRLWDSEWDGKADCYRWKYHHHVSCPLVNMMHHDVICILDQLSRKVVTLYKNADTELLKRYSVITNQPIFNGHPSIHNPSLYYRMDQETHNIITIRQTRQISCPKTLSQQFYYVILCS